eukprot:350554-Chlamydomonas_euryale.AAC.5
MGARHHSKHNSQFVGQQVGHEGGWIGCREGEGGKKVGPNPASKNFMLSGEKGRERGGGEMVRGRGDIAPGRGDIGP